MRVLFISANSEDINMPTFNQVYFVESIDLDALKITRGIRIYPHTRLANAAVEEGLIDADDDLLWSFSILVF